MNREDLEELHYITLIANILSIRERGILSHNRAKKIPHDDSLAMQEIQERRKNKIVPGGNKLHDYVNLYICARNPMMYKRHGHHRDMCVLRVYPTILDTTGTIIADRNASSDYARFGPAPDALKMVDEDLVFADDWTNPYDQIAEWRHKSVKCAEVLVPNQIPPEYIFGVYASGTKSSRQIQTIDPTIPATINGHLFFQ